MNSVIQKERVDIEEYCHVCERPITGAQGEQTYELLGRIMKFCSSACFKEYLENPEKYADEEEEDEEKT